MVRSTTIVLIIHIIRGDMIDEKETKLHFQCYNKMSENSSVELMFMLSETDVK